MIALARSRLRESRGSISMGVYSRSSYGMIQDSIAITFKFNAIHPPILIGGLLADFLINLFLYTLHTLSARSVLSAL